MRTTRSPPRRAGGQRARQLGRQPRAVRGAEQRRRIAFRLAVLRPDLVRGLLSIDGGPAESAATAGMKKAFKFGGGLVKFAVDESKLRHDVRREIVKNPATPPG